MRDLWRQRRLIWQFTLRDLQGRYRGSYLGLLWALITPLLMLAVYSVVFNKIFHARWSDQPQQLGDFALTLFSGLIAYNVFGETATMAPRVILANPNFVKKVVFPLEVLPAALVGSALLHSFLSLIIAAAGLLLAGHGLHASLLLLPLAYLPLVALSLGVGWVLASLGVFIRDIGNLAGIVVQLLFFLTPITYPLSALSQMPAWAKWLMALNPLAVIVESFRRTINWGQGPPWTAWGLCTAGCVLFMLGGYWWFNKIKPAFADVV